MHTIDRYGPDRVAGFSPIPAMSMASHAAGARYTSLIGGTMLSFYNWYADLPIASPQVFGDQTDVPESADWWNAGYLMMWGSDVPVTRTPDAHFMAEVRYKGTKVVTVSPDYADNTKFADEWMPAHPGTDGALAMAMGHVVLTEFYQRRRVPYFEDYTRRFTDSPFLVTLVERDGALVPGRFLTAADLTGGKEPDGGTSTSGMSSRSCHSWTPVACRPGVSPASRSPCRASTSRPSRGGHGLGRRGRGLREDAPRRPRDRGRRAPGDDRVRPDDGPVRGGPPRAAGGLADRVRRPPAVHPGLAGGDHRGAGRAGRPGRPGVRRQRRGDAGGR